MTDETPFLIGDANLDSGYLMMVADTDCLGTQHIALARTRHIHDIVLDAEGQLSPVFITAAMARSANVNRAPP